MGHNLYTACHKCKEVVFNERNIENNTILPFYLLHIKCAKEDINNVQTIIDNNGNDPKWIYNYKTIYIVHGDYKKPKFTSKSPIKIK